jgi:hypothetical protein
MLLTIRTRLFAMIKGMAPLGLGSVILWQVAIHSGSQKGTAYVHVSQPNVDVMVDGTEYYIESLKQTPIVCELAPGRHRLRMRQTGRVVYDEEFTVGTGQEIVLVAWERPDEAPAGGTPLSVSTNLAHLPYQYARTRP